RAGLREEQRAVRKRERRQDDFWPDPRLLARFTPPQASRDHQMHHEERILGEGEDDALADAPDVADGVSLDGFDWRIDRTQDEGAEKMQTLERPADEARLQRLDVDDDVRKLGQDDRLSTLDQWPVLADQGPPRGRGIPAGCVARRSNIPDILAPRALPSGRRAPRSGPRSARTGH